MNLVVAHPRVPSRTVVEVASLPNRSQDAFAVGEPRVPFGALMAVDKPERLAMQMMCNAFVRLATTFAARDRTRAWLALDLMRKELEDANLRGDAHAEAARRCLAVIDQADLEIEGSLGRAEAASAPAPSPLQRVPSKPGSHR